MPCGDFLVGGGEKVGSVEKRVLMVSDGKTALAIDTGATIGSGRDEEYGVKTV